MVALPLWLWAGAAWPTETMQEAQPYETLGVDSLDLWACGCIGNQADLCITLRVILTFS